MIELRGEKAKRLKEGRLYSYQKDIAERVLEGGLHILVAPTGAGKTLAALLPFLEGFEERIRHSMYHVLPTRSLANRFFRDYIEGYFGYRYEGETSQRIGELKIGLEYGGIAGTRRFMSTEIVVSTRDVFVYSLVGSSITGGYPDVPMGFIAGSYVVLDEVQMLQDEFSYGPRILKKVVETLLKIDSTVLIITATFPKKYLRLLAEYDPKVYIVGTEDPYSLEGIDLRLYPEDVEKISANRASGDRYKIYARTSKEPLEEIIETAKDYASRGKTLVVLNTVDDAIKAYKRLKDEFGEGVLLLHSRFTENDRKRKESLVDEAKLIVATQVVEAGLDLPDISYVVTYLAPVDAMIQRLGRAGRGSDYAEAVIVIPEDLDKGLPPYFYLGKALEVVKDSAEKVEELAQAMSDASIATKLVSEMFEAIEDPFEQASLLRFKDAKDKVKKREFREIITNLHRAYRALETLSINEFTDDIRARPGDYVVLAIKLSKESRPNFLRLPRILLQKISKDGKVEERIKVKAYLDRKTLEPNTLSSPLGAIYVYDNIGIPVLEPTEEPLEKKDSTEEKPKKRSKKRKKEEEEVRRYDPELGFRFEIRR